MKPFIFQFKEFPTGEHIDFSMIEYDSNLNLNVLKETKQPAIEVVNMETQTFTKENGEGADSDRDVFRMMADTATMTFSNESSDSDAQRMSLQNLMDTTTLTEASEVTDHDKPRHDTNYYA